MLTLTNSILYSQTFSSESDSLKCFTINEAKILLTYAEKGIFADSLIKVYDERIKILQEKDTKKDEALRIADEVIRSQQTELERLRRQIKFFKIGIGIEAVIILYMVLKQ